MNFLRVMLADDEPVVRQGLAMLLRLHPGLEIVGEARTGEEAVAFASQLQPDLILMDVKMPDLDGITATKVIRSLFPQIAVLVLTMHDDAATRSAAEVAGALGLLPKYLVPEKLLPIIDQLIKARQVSRDPIENQPEES